MTDKTQNAAAPRILICEDEVLLADDVAVTLRDLGYRIAGIVVTGEEAISASQALKPDLILMDIKLRGEINGIEAVEKINACMDVPVVFLLAYAEKDILERANRTEPYGYLSKPVGMAELRSTIELALYKHKADKRVTESEERLRSILDGLHDLVFVLDKEGLFADLLHGNAITCTVNVHE